MASTLESIVTCAVCLGRYRDPRVLPCQHTFCLAPCLLNLYNSDSRHLKCPMCRERHVVLRGPQTDLPVNRTILNLLDLSESGSPDITALSSSPRKCPVCLEFAADLLLCSHCDRSVCASCRSNHQRQLRADVGHSLEQLRKVVKDLRRGSSGLEHYKAQLHSNLKRTREEIHANFRQMTQWLQEREQELETEANELYEAEQRRVRSNRETAEVDLAAIDSFCSSCDASLVADIETLVGIRDQIGEYLRVGCAAASHSFGGLSLKRWRFHCESGPLRSFVSNCGSLIMVERTPPASPLPRQPFLRQQWHPAEGRNSVLPALTAAALESRAQSARSRAQPSPHSSPEPSSQLSLQESREASPERSSSEEDEEEEEEEEPLAPPRLERSRTYVMQRTARPVSFEISFEPDRPRRSAGGPAGGAAAYDERGVPLAVIGRRGQGPGELSWPRGVAVSGEKKARLLVADSSNHRMQIFSLDGSHRASWGAFGQNEGEFQCLTDVALDPMGQLLATDRYQHCVQLFDPGGRFVARFGQEGSGSGELSNPWGVCVDQLGFIYVCDHGNHRVQVFQLDGAFVRSFGSRGKRRGHLEHPHYVAVSPKDGRLFVADSGNHRVVSFDSRADRCVASFGTSGSGPGQLRFPRGIAVDTKGNVLVADGANNRVQIFSEAGQSLCSFGSYGAGHGQFKGLEGLAVTRGGHIVVSDRDNHRVQIF